MEGGLMILSPLTGVPIAQGPDFATDYPATVDEPRTRLLETFTTPRFADTATRDAAIPAPVEGQESYVGELDQHQIYREATLGGSGWAPIGGSMPWARLDWGVIPAGVGGWPIGVVANSFLRQGGFRSQDDATPTGLIIPFSGIYHVTVGMAFSLIIGNARSMAFAGDWANWHIQGTTGAPASGGILHSIATAQFSYTAGQELFARYWCEAVCQIDFTVMTVTYVSAY